jgi:hypothetical protein
MLGSMRLPCLLPLGLTLALGAVEPPLVVRQTAEMPSVAPLKLASFNKEFVPECSALWASPTQPGLFWTLSDSGAKPRLSALRSDGSFAAGPAGPWRSVELKGAANVDWEAITGDSSGRMIVCDVGNNVSLRKELALYVFAEPKVGTSVVADFRKIAFAWPDQKSFPDPELAHDCEAAFMVAGRLYLLTKHRRDTLTDLWRVDLPAPGAPDKAVPVKVGRLDAKGMVTDAAVSPDGHRLAILTYTFLWVFDLPASGEAFFSGYARSAPLSLPALSWQVEGCSWLDDQTILLGSEQGDLFRLPVSALQEAK